MLLAIFCKSQNFIHAGAAQLFALMSTWWKHLKLQGQGHVKSCRSYKGLIQFCLLQAKSFLSHHFSLALVSRSSSCSQVASALRAKVQGASTPNTFSVAKESICRLISLQYFAGFQSTDQQLLYMTSGDCLSLVPFLQVLHGRQVWYSFGLASTNDASISSMCLLAAHKIHVFYCATHRCEFVYHVPPWNHNIVSH